MLFARIASGWHLDDLITSVPMQLYSIYDPTEMLTLPLSGPEALRVSYMLHLKTNGPFNSITPKPSPRKLKLEEFKQNTIVSASGLMTFTIKFPLLIEGSRSSGFIDRSSSSINARPGMLRRKLC